MPGDRGDNHDVGTGRLQPSGETRKCRGLRVRRAGAEVADQLGGIGVDHRQVEGALRLRVGPGEVAVVELGGGGADATDEPDVHRTRIWQNSGNGMPIECDALLHPLPQTC